MKVMSISTFIYSANELVRMRNLFFSIGSPLITLNQRAPKAQVLHALKFIYHKVDFLTFVEIGSSYDGIRGTCIFIVIPFTALSCS